MKHLFKTALLTTVITSGTLFASDLMSVGSRAFFAGDYRTAVKCYEDHLQQTAASGSDHQAWLQGVQNLGTAYIHNGETGKARLLFQRLLRENPGYTDGIFEGQLLAAEGKYEQAEKLLRQLKTSSAVSEDARLFILAAICMQTDRLDEAYQLFSEVSGRIGTACSPNAVDDAVEALKSGRMNEAQRVLGRLAARPESPWKFFAASESVYTLIRMGKVSEALTVLAEIPRDKYTFNTELLLYLAEAHQGNVSNLKKNFDQFLEKMPPRSSMRVLELFTAAADAARKSGDGQFAAILIRNAASTTADPAIKQLLARQLIAVSIDSAPDAAAQETIAYFRSYPNDKERMDLLMRTAAILYHRQAYRQAMDLYAFAIDNGGAAEAMTNAVGCAEQLKDFAALQKFNYQLFARDPDQIMHRMRYTAFLEENRKFDLAEKELLAAVSHAEKLPDTAAADKLQLLVMEFYRRHGNAEKIRSAAEKLERSTDKNYVAAAKLQLGELLEKSSGFMQAKKYFMDVEALAVKDLSPRASFKSALMSYRNYSFGSAAGEFFACAEKYPDYEKSAEALFMAYSLFDMQNDTVNAARADKMLREKYANCAAFAVLILDQAAKNNRNMPPEKLLADLESVEKNFPDSNFAAEARLLRGIFTAGTGKNKEALEILQELFTNRNRSVAAESLIRAGEILFSSGNFPEAGKYFTQSAAIDPGSRSSDIAALRAADCVLADKAPQNRQQLEKCIDSLTMLAEKSSFPAIRLEAAYKSAVAMQFAGMREKAAETFKTSIYRAADMYEKGVDINSAWCIKSCEAVLGMIQPGDRGGLAEGMKLLDVCRKILPDQDLSRMKQNFREKMSKKRR